MAPGDHILPDPAGFGRAARTSSPGATRELGGRVGGLLRGGEIVLLYGDLGAGKTAFVQGICSELAVAQEVVSPTFTLVNTYDGRLRVQHLDFYRVEPGHDLDDIGVPDILDEIWDGAAVGLIEWPSPLLARLGSAARFEILVRPTGRGDEREFLLRARPELPAGWAALFPPREERAC